MVSLSMKEHKGAKAKYRLTKAERLEARVSHEQKVLFQYAADLVGRSFTDFVVQVLQEAAARIVEAHEVIKLGIQDRRIFVKALLNSPAPNKNLIKAMKRYKKEVIAK